MKSGAVQKFYFKAGVDLVLKVNPEVKFEQGAFASVKCKPAKVWSRRFPLAGLLSAFLEPGLKFYPSLEVGGALTAGNSLRAGFKLDFSRSYWTGGTYTPVDGWKPLCSTWQECSNSNNTKSIYLEKSTFEKPMSINFKMGAYYNLVAGFQIGGELIGTIKDWFGSLPLIGEKIESIADDLYIDLLTAKAGPETQTVWSNTEWVLFNEKNQSGANTYVAATLSATYPRLKTLILKLFKIPLPETPPPPLLALPQLNILEPYRNLIAESITSPSANPVTVKASQTVEVRATIARNVQWLQPITDLIALPLDVHTTWPHRAELWLKTGDSALGGNITHIKLGNLSVQNERILTGSFTVTADMCQKAALSLSKTVTIKLIAYNYMYNVVESPNFVGDFKISCSDLSAQPR